ncbi:MAG: hypothetical protein CMR00_10020 [[Chlorobium] sp. 445]|nr:MAG: hypothetical protein CMR00_10020 [[Chlorobium] sp. 445]
MLAMRIVLFICFLCLIGCQRPSEPPSTLAEPEATVSSNGLVFALRIARDKVGIGDTISGVFEIRNNSGIERTFFFLYQQHFALEVQQENGEVISVRTVPNQISANILRIPINERRSYPFAFVPRHLKTDAALPAGTYWLCGYLLENHSPKVRLKLTITSSSAP